MNSDEQNILYFDCFSGISGDMAVAALLDLGIDAGEFRRELGTLGLHDYDMDIREEVRNGFRCKRFVVNCREEEHRHRNLDDIFAIIDRSGMADGTRALSRKIFAILGQAEAAVHGTTIDNIHFHEVGAVDSIVDIVSFAICFRMLNPGRVWSSPVNLGSGLVRCAHGILPVPAPAVAEIARGIPVYATEMPRRELATPTGMAILKAVCHEYHPLPEMVPGRVGYGAGQGESDLPNVLRVFYGPFSEAADILILETNIDDMNPEFYGYIFEKLLGAGALDVYLTSIVMKKNRPGQKLSVLCEKRDEEAMEGILFRETSTIGLRKTSWRRSKLERRMLKISTPYGEMRIKAAYRAGEAIKYSPEYEDCRAAALITGKPLREVYDEVKQLALGRMGNEKGG